MATESKQTEINTFDVIVVASAMSPGKSTLINALLGTKLMPSKNELCTAKIVKITGIDEKSSFSAILKRDDGSIISYHDEISLSAMQKANDDPQVSYIDLEGNIPFVSSKSIQLSLTDTPGYAPEYIVKLINEANETNSIILFVLNATQLGIRIEDDHHLLGVVAKAMKVGGKQSKDRFIFVVNKMDAFDPEIESIEDVLSNTREYLKNHGIDNPNIYPVSAEMAKLIRLYQKGDTSLTKKEVKGFEIRCTIFNDEEQRHLSNYASLSNKNKSKIDEMFNEARANNDPHAEALIHTGVPALELAINEYIDNYLHPDAVTKIDVPETELSTMEYIDKNRSSSQMTKFYLKYNPFTVESIMKINGKDISKDSKLYKWRNKIRFQMWGDSLLDELIRECNDDCIEIDFHGTKLDYEDFVSFKEDFCSKNKGIEIKLNNTETRCSEDRIEELKELFFSMQQNTPFEELKDEKIVAKFNKALDSTFEVAVLATMSAGKSTLINSLLGRELMPSKNGACTAKIVKIRDVDGKNSFGAKCTDNKNEKILSEKDNINVKDMNEFNKDDKIFYINIEGDIPFITSKKVELVLFDTPGPNSNKSEHKEATFTLIKDDSSKPIILYMLNATQIAVEDDKRFLKSIAEEIKNGGKQSKDRFMFVVNKIDDLDPESEGDTVEDILIQVKEYLEKELDINRPNIYPVSAELAKLIRMHQKNHSMTTQQKKKLEKYEYFIAEKTMHLSQYAPLSHINKLKIDTMIDETKANNDLYAEALIHTGVPALELAINEYLEKYAIPMKIEDAIDVFIDKINEERLFDKLINDLKDNEKQRKEFNKTLKFIEKQISDGEKAKQFKEDIDKLSIDSAIDEKISNLRSKISSGLNISFSKKNSNEKMSFYEAENNLTKIRNDIKNIESDINTDIIKITQNILVKNATEYLNEYSKHLDSLIQDQEYIPNQYTGYNSFEFININMPNYKDLLQRFKKAERVKDGEYKIPNPEKEGFWGKLKFWLDDEINVAKYKNVDFIDAQKMFHFYYEEITGEFNKNIEKAKSFFKKQAMDFKKFFSNEIDLLDNIIKEKIKRRQELSESTESIEQKIKENQNIKVWLENFEQQFKNIAYF